MAQDKEPDIVKNEEPSKITQKDENLVDESKPEEEGKPFLFIIPFQSDFLTKLENDQASKLLLQVGSKQLDYKLVLSSLEDFKGLKRKVVSVELEIKKVGMTMEVTALMKDVSTNFQLRKKTRHRVNKRSLIREINIVLELLFLSEDEIMEREQKEERDKKFKKRFSNSLIVPDNGLAAFRARIRALKKNIKIKFKELEEEENKDEEEDEEDNQTNMIAKKPKEDPDKDNNSLFGKRIWVYFDSLSAGVMNQNTNMTKQFAAIGEPLDLNTNVPYLTAAYTKGVYLDVDKDYYAIGTIGIGQSFTQVKEVQGAEVNGDISMFFDMSASAGYNLKDIKLMVDAGLRLHGINYISLEKSGSGLEPISNTVLFFQGGVTKKFAYYNREIELRGIVKIPVMTFSSDDSIANGGGFSGLGYGFSVKTPKIYWNWLNLQFEMEKSSYTVASIFKETVDNTMVSFKGFYDF